jgi:hypothetical protein
MFGLEVVYALLPLSIFWSVWALWSLAAFFTLFLMIYCLGNRLFVGMLIN